MSSATAKAKDGAQRKKEYDARRRAQGMRPVQFWLTAEEERQIRLLLQALRR